ncbi:MAG TPA: hypothetical protein ENK25_02655 [Bacteroidetes bacterium]|nr:hypothetical protein [Bacteroidota bacterium]
MKDYSTFHLHFFEEKQPHGLHTLENEMDAGAEMDRDLVRIFGPSETIEVPEIVLRRLFYRIRLLSHRFRN